jgi:hypothetical protein
MIHRRPVPVLLLCATLLSAAPVPSLAEQERESAVEAGELSVEEIAKARRQLAERLEDTKTTRERALILGRIGLVERAKGALGHAAREQFWLRATGADGVISLIFDRAPARSRVEILNRYRQRWDLMGRGTSGARNRMVRDGLLDRDPDVRRAAARLAAQYSFPRMGHHAIDAAMVYPELTLAAVLTVARNGDHRGCRWALKAGAREQGAVREAAVYAFRRAGEPCKERLVAFLDSEDPARRLLAAEGVLQLATPEDAPLLRDWAERWGDRHPEMAERALEAAEQLALDVYEPPEPDRPELAFPEGD